MMISILIIEIIVTQSNAVRGGLPVEPEPDPGENNNESTGQIDLTGIMRSVEC